MDPFKVLGLEWGQCTEEDVSKAYKKLALTYHPDKNPGKARFAAEQRMKEINNAKDRIMQKNLCSRPPPTQQHPRLQRPQNQTSQQPQRPQQPQKPEQPQGPQQSQKRQNFQKSRPLGQYFNGPHNPKPQPPTSQKQGSDTYFRGPHSGHPYTQRPPPRRSQAEGTHGRLPRSQTSHRPQPASQPTPAPQKPPASPRPQPTQPVPEQLTPVTPEEQEKQFWKNLTPLMESVTEIIMDMDPSTCDPKFRPWIMLYDSRDKINQKTQIPNSSEVEQICVLLGSIFFAIRQLKLTECITKEDEDMIKAERTLDYVMSTLGLCERMQVGPRKYEYTMDQWLITCLPVIRRQWDIEDQRLSRESGG